MIYKSEFNEISRKACHFSLFSFIFLDNKDQVKTNQESTFRGHLLQQKTNPWPFRRSCNGHRIAEHGPTSNNLLSLQPNEKWKMINRAMKESSPTKLTRKQTAYSKVNNFILGDRSRFEWCNRLMWQTVFIRDFTFQSAMIHTWPKTWKEFLFRRITTRPLKLNF